MAPATNCKRKMKIKLSNNKKRWLLFFLGLMWMVVIFLFSAKHGNVSSRQSGSIAKLMSSFFGGEMSTVGMNFLEVFLRKAAHVGEFAILGGVWYGHFLLSPKTRISPHTATLIISITYAVFDEVHQFFVPGRAARWYDVAFDTFGIVLGILAVMFVIWRYKNGSKNN